MEHDILFGNSNRENGPTFLDFPLFLGIFQWDEPTKRVPFTAEPEIPEILTKWKAAYVSLRKDELRRKTNSWVAVTSPKNQTKKLSILLSFYFHEVLQYLNTSFCERGR